MENKNQTFKILKNPNEIVAHWIKVCVDVIVLQLMLIIGLAHALVVFRVVAAPLMSESKWEFLKDNANLVSVFLGAVLHYITIQIMTRVCIPGSSLSVGRMNRKSMFRLTSLKYYPGDPFDWSLLHTATSPSMLSLKANLHTLLKQSQKHAVWTSFFCKSCRGLQPAEAGEHTVVSLCVCCLL